MLKRTFRFLDGRVLSQDFPHARLVTLNKPKALNSLDLGMIEQLHEIYITAPAASSSIYILKGTGGKAFCAGGDVVSITTNKPEGCQQSFFYREFQMNYHLMTMKAPNVALWDGYVMGGGVGISIPGKYRVATEKATFAMPETAIGMFPDVGGSWFLPRMSVPEIGLFMGLTGHRVKGADLIHTGLATHYVPSNNLQELEQALCNITDAAKVKDVLDHFQPASLPPFTMETHLRFIENIYALNENTTIGGIIDGSRAAAGTDKLAKFATDSFPAFSPTALCLTLEILKRGAALTNPIDAFKQEYCATQRLCAGGDFIEGVRALLIDKDKSPKWNPKTLNEITPEFIDSFFKSTSKEQVVWDPVKPFKT